MEKIIIGSDIVLDLLYNRNQRADHSERILAYCENRLIQGVITATALGNIYYNLRKNADHGKIGERLSLLLTFLEVSTASSKEFIEALNTDMPDLECAMNSLSAENIYGISAIVTGNVSGYKNTRTTVKNAEEFLSNLVKG